ncbi:hypothetical protein GALMADRAFT_235661 [Galerina marginata CBS 339.88]|uniref:Uncharacterized protein n=1 Tax=Galerina marginata (strain CBS 339.88) TaxID=685588 RepID=A0A067TK42_GALM3|nr:hypothetical protein GALMADRAFT_235661 [Galerina marginata CBS 339.88]
MSLLLVFGANQSAGIPQLVFQLSSSLKRVMTVCSYINRHQGQLTIVLDIITPPSPDLAYSLHGV